MPIRVVGVAVWESANSADDEGAEHEDEGAKEAE